MTAPMITLAEFLLARIDEDEQAARDAGGSRWLREMTSCVISASSGGLIVYGEGTPSREQADHIARHDPARVLAECKAKQDIVDDCEALLPDYPTSGATLADRVLRRLALPYADHPDYREEWRP